MNKETILLPIENMREKLIDRIRVIVEEFAGYENLSNQERCDGVAHSILATLDGCAPEIPCFDIKVKLNPDEIEFYSKYVGGELKNGETVNQNNDLHDIYRKRFLNRLIEKIDSDEENKRHLKKGCCSVYVCPSCKKKVAGHVYVHHENGEYHPECLRKIYPEHPFFGHDEEN
ncbi:MAG: hypothetical protein ACOCQD_02805 [archaeon]